MSSLWIINKAGGLIYQADRFAGTQKLTSNEALILAGTLHGVHAITARLNPVPNTYSAGLDSLESDNFKMTVLLTPTGIKFVLISSPWHPNPHAALQRAYEAYADQVMKNPFYTPEMPIRVEGFDRAIDKIVAAAA